MQNTNPEMLQGLVFSSRQREILAFYATRLQARIKKAIDDILSFQGRYDNNPGEMVGLEAELQKFIEDLLNTASVKLKLSKHLGFWFVDEMQKDIDPMTSVPDATFTHVPRQEMRSHMVDATFYELLYIFYLLGSPFIRTVGVNALPKYPRLDKPSS